MKHLRHNEKTVSPLLAYPDSLASTDSELIINAQLHQQMLQAQDGRLCPAAIPVNGMQYALDLGCGSGEWIFDLAKRYPQLYIYGIDKSEEVLHQAKLRRNIAAISQIELRQLDLLNPLPLPDQSMDLIHMRRCAEFITPDLWPSILDRCVRILRPQGWLVLVEMEICEVSSPACQTLQRALLQALIKLNRTMGTSGTTLGVVQNLYGMLLQTPLVSVSYELHTADLGFMSEPGGNAFLTALMRQITLMKPVIIQQGILSATRFASLMQQARSELQEPDICGWAIILSAYGKRAEG